MSSSRDTHGEPIPASDLILNEDGTIFHLHLHPGDVPETVILVGDPGRVALVGEHLSQARALTASREFCSLLGKYRGRGVLVQSTGIGAGCVDIVLNELDALVNIDFPSRRPYRTPRSLSFTRIGTSGALHRGIGNGEAIITSLSVGFDTIPWLYQGGNAVFETGAMRAYEAAFNALGDSTHVNIYAVRSDRELVERLSPLGLTGITYCCPGFYGAQMRKLRALPAYATLFEAADSVEYDGMRALNMEMESAPLNALASLLGHRAATITLAIDNRHAETVRVNYAAAMDSLIARTLDALIPVPPIPC